jgi:phosphate transport system ATP-binding protein
MVNSQIKENSDKENKKILAKGSEPMNEEQIETPKETAQKDVVLIEAKGFNAYYDGITALKNINLQMHANNVVAIIGPSGCGKSTFLRSINRMNDLIQHFTVDGDLNLNGNNIYNEGVDVTLLRRRVGMVFQKPNPFPKSIFENVAYGLRINRLYKNQADLEAKVEQSLREAGLWEEVKNILSRNAFDLSGGQQQRLCIARCLVIKPEVILMDEPTASLDPLSTSKIEELIIQLKKNYTIVIVTHNMQQAARIADMTAFFMLGEVMQYDSTSKMFTNPGKKITEDYITGRFG